MPGGADLPENKPYSALKATIGPLECDGSHNAKTSTLETNVHGTRTWRLQGIVRSIIEGSPRKQSDVHPESVGENSWDDPGGNSKCVDNGQ